MSVQRWKPSWAQGRMIPAGVHPVDGYVSAADHARIVAERIVELTGERDRARDVAVRLEQELAAVNGGPDFAGSAHGPGYDVALVPSRGEAT